MGREKREDRDRGSPKVRFERGKIVFDSGHRETRGRQELKKSEQGRKRNKREMERKINEKESQSHCGQTMGRPGRWAVSCEEALLNGW
jgi:hypothetical protein